MVVAFILEISDGTKYLRFKCPACNEHEAIPFQAGTDYKGPVWKFNGNLEAPTLSPSVRHYMPDESGRVQKTLCHYHLVNGVIDYCTDSSHKLSGQKAALPEITPDN